MSVEGPTSLFRAISGLRHFGVGTKVSRSIFKFPDTYWVVTGVKLSPDQKHGKVMGRLVWKGLPRAADEEIHSALKREWKVIGFPDYNVFKNTSECIANQIPKTSAKAV